MIKRHYDIGSLIRQVKVLIIYGPRQVGKTTLLEGLLKETRLRYLCISGDNIRVQDVLSSRDFNRITRYIEGYDLIAIDEAQMVPDTGMALKIIVDKYLFAIATGTSSFRLA